jgi:uncharacterized protein (DUF1697 family)
MPTYIALLRAVNVGGTGKLAMVELKAMCVAAGFKSVQTYIASGNVVFTAEQPASTVKAALEKRLRGYAGKPVDVIVRTVGEMKAVLKNNPFPKMPPNRTLAVFLDDAPSPDALSALKGQSDEKVRLGKREIYVAYGAAGIGRSTLKIPAAENGTARNINTVAKLVEIASAI